MKKYFLIIMIVFIGLLTACSNGTKDTNTRVDAPSENLTNVLKLNSVQEGKEIKEVDKTKKEYYSIRIAEDTKSTLFVYNTMVDSQIEEHKTKIETFNINPLTFSSQITTTEATKIMSEIFDAKTGITKETLGVDFNLKASSAWTRTIKAKEVVDAYINQNQRDNALSIIYLPVYVEHVQNNKTTLKVFVMVPVYYELTTCIQGVVQAETFKDIPVLNLSFTEDNLLD